MNAESNLAEDDWIYGEFQFVPAKPINHAGARLRFGGFAQDIGIDEKCHNVSVDSDSIGTK